MLKCCIRTWQRLANENTGLVSRKVFLIKGYQPTRKMASSKGNDQVTQNFAETDKFVSDVFEMGMKQAIQAGRDRSNPVIRFKTPEELGKCVNFTLNSDGVKHSELLSLCNKVFENSVLTGHPRFCNQQYVGGDEYGFAGEIVTSALNTNAHTFEICPVFNMTEVAVLDHVKKIAGFHGDSTFCPGGTYSNMLAMNAARIRRFPESKSNGISGLPPLMSFYSEQGHYSAKKNSALLGFGDANCVAVKCDENGKMIPEELERQILKGKAAGAVPFFVTATAATTVLGSFDPFHAIADICQKYNMWMHVDGAWGASALLSQKHKHLCDGVERADSMAWNFHKMTAAPNQCSVLLLQEKDILKKCNSINVPYLFQEGKPYDESYDLGRNLVQCGRRADAFKLWLMWKAKGGKGMEEQVNRAVENAQYLTKAIKARPNFKMVIPEPAFANVPFWFIPPSMRSMKEDDDFNEKLSKVVPTIKLRMQKSGSLLIGFSPTPSVPTFFRMVVINKLLTHEDMDFILDEIERKGSDL